MYIINEMESIMQPSIQIYTDGGNRNTGNFKGGKVKPTDKSAWAALLIYGTHRKSITGGEYGKTNNYMEIMAVIQALKALKRTDIPIVIYADSAYVINTMQQKWYLKWQAKNWHNVKNAELWQELIKLITKFSQVTFVKVKGHANDQNNNYVDALLNKTMDNM